MCDWYEIGHLAGLFMLVGGLSAQAALIMNYFFPTALDGKTLSSFFDHDL